MNRLKLLSEVLAIASMVFLLNNCYEPEQMVSVNPNPPTESKIKPINVGAQICNPSASNNPRHFEGQMLWLGFDQLSVNVPAKWASEYKTGAGEVIQHDRLQITDETNTLTWYMMKPDFITGAQFQDPEWSTHPDYIAVLGQKAGIGDIWGGYVARISDKKILKFNDNKLAGVSTPHLWLPEPDASAIPDLQDVATTQFTPSNAASFDSDGNVDKATVQEFFGTDSVKIVYVLNEFIYFIDYSQASPAAVKLNVPADKEGYKVESPMISPNGEWIAYHYRLAEDGIAYIQKLEANSSPILASSPGTDPHWFVDPDSRELFLIYADAVGPLGAYLDEVPQDGSEGNTYYRLINLNSSWRRVGEENLLLGLPFQGGITKDGTALVTGYQWAYIYLF
ncbi:MAG: hypothetical protein GF398_06985 [Chitinivibrionales bacterium]|nr:hypothetical protein [Chitinivibrionales bacterium]